MSEIRTFRFQTVPKSEHKSELWDFWDVLLGFQTVSEIRMFEHVPLASKWLATGFFGFAWTHPHLASLNK